MKNNFKIIAFIYILLMGVIFIGCERKTPYKIIESKFYSDGLSGFMPDGICRYLYRNGEESNLRETQEKCDCYNVGDTIK